MRFAFHHSAVLRLSLCYLLPFKRGYMLLSLLFVRIHAQHTKELPNALESKSTAVIVEWAT
jgi:hypothetical protein